MGSPAQPATKIVFGPFEYDGVSGDLRKFGNRIRLQGQPLQILAALLERPGQVVNRGELQRRLWHGATFVDFEQGLNAAVNKLRQALGDSADQPRYVETLAGRGYRFIAPVQRGSGRTVVEMAQSVPVSPHAEVPSSSRFRRWLPWTTALALALAAIGIFRFGPRRQRSAGILNTVRFTVAPPSGFALEGASSRQSFALSPDGTRLAFTAMDASGAMSVFVRDFDSLETRLLPQSLGSNTMFWAPDGQSLFLTVQGKLQRASLRGEGRVVISDTPPFLFAGAWLGPDRLLLTSTVGCYVVSPSGGTPQTVQAAYRWPQLLPDGEHILYVSWDAGAAKHRAKVARWNDPASAKDLLESDSRVMYSASVLTRGKGYLLYIRSGNLLAAPFDTRSLSITGEAIPIASQVYSFFPTGAADFSVSDQGTLAYYTRPGRSQLVAMDRAGRRLKTMGPANINVKAARWSPDGKKFATAIYDVDRGMQDLWIFDTQTNLGSRLTPQPGLRDAPVWSPDSRTVAFLSAGEGRMPQVHIRGLGAADREEALAPGGFQKPTDWSPDGRFIALDNTGSQRFANETQGDVWLIDMTHGRKPIPLLSTPFHEAELHFSPDGKWVAFTSSESGQTELYLQAFDASDPPKVTGERYRASRGGALALRWRRDAKELFYLAYDGRVHAIPVRLAPKPQFGAANTLFSISTQARASIHSLDGFDVAPDGNQFVIPEVRSLEADPLVVVENWEAALRRP